MQAEFAVFAVAVDPLAGAGAGDTHLRGDMGDRASLAALHEASAALDGQRRITVCHDGLSFGGRGVWRFLILNRPGMSGDFILWEGWSHVIRDVEEVSAGVA